MSQLTKAVIANETEKLSPLFKDMLRMEERVYEIPDDYISKVYEIGVTLKNSVAVNISECSKIDSLEFAIEQTKQRIVEAVFGEFRECFYLLDDAINNHDFSKAKLLLEEFQHKMFNID